MWGNWDVWNKTGSCQRLLVLKSRRGKQERRLGNEKWGITRASNKRGVIGRRLREKRLKGEEERKSASSKVELKDYHYCVNAPDTD